MRLLLAGDCVGGVWTHCLDIASELTRRGHDVFLAVAGGELRDDQRADVSSRGLYGWEARPYRLEWMPDSAADVDATGRWLLDLAADHDPELVHLSLFAPATLPWSRPVLVAAHSDVVTWWRAVKGVDPPPEWAAYADRVRRALEAADHVVAPTAAMLGALRLAYPFDTGASVIHNGSTAPAAPARRAPLLVAAGRLWDEGKNLSAAAQAARGLAWPLVVAGEGTVAGARSMGRLAAPDLARLLATASIFVEPARYEPFGLTALEAARAGCALVLGDIPSLREVWGDAATFVPPDDVSALRAALTELIDDPSALRAAAGAARARARRYSVEAMADGYESTYRLLLSAPVSPAGAGR